MNPQQHAVYREKYSNFDDVFVHAIPISDVEISHISDQVRTAGEDKNHVGDLVDQIGRLGQLTPATGQRLPGGKIKLHAGVHRYCALHHIEKTTGKPQTLRIAMGFEDINFQTHADEVFYQLNENTPLAKKNLDIDDYVQALTGLIKDDHVLGTDLKALTPKRLRTFVRKKIPNLTNYKIDKIVKNILKKAIFNGQHKYRNYATKTEAAETFTKINPWGLSVERSGDSDRGISVYFAESLTAVSQNSLHGAWHVKAKEESSQVLLVVYCGNVRVKTRDLAKWRRDAVVKFKKENDHPRFVGDIFDGIVFLPQALMGTDAECQNTLLNPLDFHWEDA